MVGHYCYKKEKKGKSKGQQKRKIIHQQMYNYLLFSIFHLKIKLFPKSEGNQLNFLPNLKEINKIPHQILGKSIGNQLHSLPNPSEFLSESNEFLAKSFTNR